MAKDNLNPDTQGDIDEINEAGQGAGDVEGMVMDLTDTPEEFTYEPIPAGVYDCIIEQTNYKKSKSGNRMIEWRFKVIDPEYEDRLLFNYTVLNNPRGKSELKKTLIRAVPDVDLGSFDPKTFCEEGQALGLPCKIKVGVGTDQNGEPSNEVKDVLPAGEEDFLD